MCAQENNMAQKTVFITGVAGFLGSHLADTFLAAGYKVKGCDSLLGGYRDNVPEGVEFFEMDLNDFDKTREITKGVDIVYHCAATAYEGLSVFSPNIISKHIIGASMSIMTAAIANDVKRLVLCSSMARYGTQTEFLSPRT
jgi:UDP-glucose 4-epimerase